ncbi:dipeptidase [Flavobacteriaceae bacterium]|nr:dipeptidase [Flavobacteriaceae bacterium]MDC1235711.1 dipeptidase [Flavobacteriaceae bacterium]MDC1518691.1 dipeptidase [Flavobacteriaceae bacterium]
MKTIYGVLFALLLIQCQDTNSTPDVSLLQKAQLIHLTTTTLDTHDDINVKNFTDSLNYTQNLDTQVNLPKMQAGALDVAWFIVYTGQGELTPEGYKKAAENAQAKFDAIHRLVEVYGKNKIALATTSKEVDSLRKIGKKVAMIGVENAFPIGENIEEVARYYAMGARYMSLAHNGHNQFSDSNTGEFDNTAKHNGISELGKQIIEKMNYYGIMVDISHPSKEAIRQTIAHSKAPVIASHSSARALSDHPRNLDDAQLQWVKDSGGVVQTVALAAFLNKEKAAAHKKAKDSLLKTDPNADLAALKATYPPVNVSDFVDHIDYIKNKIGIDHVGISSDFDGGGGIEGWKDASETFNVTLELVKRGYSEEEIAKIWSGNLLRVLDRVQAVAQELQNIE